jgi:dienelactone hydrolase
LSDSSGGTLAGFDRTRFEHDGKEREVFRTGHGPAVIVIAEIPGITPDVISVARRIADLGCTVALPHLFGVPGRDPMRRGNVSMAADTLSSIVPACISREFAVLATGDTSPVIDWLRALARSLHAECGGPGVGVVGMCFTGGFALGMVADSPVLAPVLSQPSLPFAITGTQKASVGLSSDDLTAAVDACAARDITVLGFRFTGDRAVPPQRFETLRRVLGDRFVGVEIDSSKGNPWGHPRSAHSVLTMHLVDEPGQPTRDALDQMLELFRTRLLTDAE